MDYIDYVNKIKELDAYTKSFPKKYFDLYTKIDQYIYGAQQGFEIASEAYIIASELYTKELALYTLELSNIYNHLRENGNPVSSIKEDAKMQCINNYKVLIEAENIKDKAKIIREIWSEKLNTLKKIKTDPIRS